MIVAGRPIAEAETREDERALMFALFAQDGARSFVRLRELQQTEDKVREQIEKANDSLGAYQAELMRVQEAEAARPPVSNPSTIALVMMGVLILLGFVLFILDNPGFGMLVFLLALISGGVGMALRSKQPPNFCNAECDSPR